MSFEIGILVTVVLAFTGIFAKFWCDLREPEVRFGRTFRKELRECSEEYWSRFVYGPINRFFSRASEKLFEEDSQYGALQDLLLDTDWAPSLESDIIEAAESQKNYTRLRNLSESLVANQNCVKRMLGRILVTLVLLLILLLLSWLLDFLGVMLGSETTPVFIPFLSSALVIGFLLLLIVLSFFFWKAFTHQKTHDANLAFYAACQGRLDSNE